MKMLKLKKGPIIVVLVTCAILLIVGVVFALLPEKTYISWGDSDSAMTRYYPLIFCGVIDLILLLSIWTSTASQKKTIEKVNAILQNLGEDAVALSGSIVDREAARQNARKTAVSVFGGFLSALFLGVGVYRVYGNNNARYFILYSEGMYIFDMRDKSEIQLNKVNVRGIQITEKRNSLIVELIPSIAFAVNTKGLDVSTEDLIAKFKEVFTNPVPDPFQNA